MLAFLKSASRSILALALSSLSMASAWGQSNTREPQIGYLYPAGGQQGSVIRITAGGQFLRGVTDVYVSGEGVRASVVKYIPPLRFLDRPTRQLLQQRLQEVRDKRLAELPGFDPSMLAAPRRAAARRAAAARQAAARRIAANQANVDNPAEVKLPDHPLLDDLENKSLRELAHISDAFFAPRGKQQPNRQLNESVLLEITIAPDAKPGNREIRIGTRIGLTNPLAFQVGVSPEIRELEPNNRQAYPPFLNLPPALELPKDKPLELPVLINGQVKPGDVDRFRFRARQGQQLVIETQARSLIPYLADAVPGWFQATLTLYDAAGAEVAFADDYRFNPDPVLFYRIPQAGEYELEIHDALYRGRVDFVYRILIGERPFITQLFPLGGQEGVKTVASIAGWNLPGNQLPLDTKPGDSRLRRLALRQGKQLSNAITYAVDTLPESNETETNNTRREAQRIVLPMVVNGRIDQPGDVDMFQFSGRAGDRIVAEVYGRRLNSPLDSLLRLIDASGATLEWNDDLALKDERHLHQDLSGLLTHHADSYLMAELPKNGVYYVQLTDAQHHGGAEYGYRVRISAPQPDFALRVTPSSLFVRTGSHAPFTVHVLRKDGFNGEIHVALNNAPAGFALHGARIPAGCDRLRMTLSAPLVAPDRPVTLTLAGRARIGERTVSHPAMPADDVMQAFLYRHLAPAQELLVSVQKVNRRTRPATLIVPLPVRISVSDGAWVRLNTRTVINIEEIKLELLEPPEGITVGEVIKIPRGLAFKLMADKNVALGLADNLIVEIFREFTPLQQDGQPAPQRRRQSMGILPAIPIEIVQR